MKNLILPAMARHEQALISFTTHIAGVARDYLDFGESCQVLAQREYTPVKHERMFNAYAYFYNNPESLPFENFEIKGRWIVQ